jgi:hypothetical protein
VRVFISCAWEDAEYLEFVKGLAARLRKDGIDALKPALILGLFGCSMRKAFQ